jgi:hypothetical protein
MRSRRTATTLVATTTALVLGAGPALADEDPPSPQEPITLTAEQSAALCRQRIPAVLDRIARLEQRAEGDASTPGSTAWLQERIERAKEEGRTQAADRLEQRLSERPERLAQLDDVEQRVVAFREEHCA